jgi:uncharacterized membrane protein
MLTDNTWRSAGWILMCVLILTICVYASSYFIPGMSYGFRPDFYRQSTLTVFPIAHIGGAIVAVLAGPLQFWRAFRLKYKRTHRILGLTYLCGVTIGGVSALIISPIAKGGLTTQVGFYRRL